MAKGWSRWAWKRGEIGLGEHLRRPYNAPLQPKAQIEAAVLEAKKATGYGRMRLAWHLYREEGLVLLAIMGPNLRG